MRLTWVLVKILILIHISAAKFSQIYFPSVQEILNFISHSPEKYTVHFQTSNKFIELNYPYSFYTRCFPCTFVFPSPAKNNTTFVGLFETRYQSRFYLIFIASFPQTEKLFNLGSTYKYSFLTTTIYFIYCHTLDLLMRMTDKFSPATKILIKQRKANLVQVDVGRPICNDYCDLQEYNMETWETHRLMVDNPNCFHKNLFKIARGQSIIVTVIGSERYHEMFRGKDQHIFSDFVGTAHKNEVSRICDEELLSVIQLAETHNLSINILGANENLDKLLWTQLVQQYSQLTPIALQYEIVSGTIFSQNAHLKLVYCKDNFVHASYQLWTTAFPKSVWVTFFATLIVVAILYQLGNILSCFELIVIALGQNIYCRRNEIMWFIIYRFFIRSLFENTLTSVIVVPPEAATYANLKEMILDNVKILIQRNLSWDISFSEVIKMDFRRSGIEHLLNDSYEYFEDDIEKYVVAKYMRHRVGINYAIVSNEDSAKNVVYLFTTQLLNQTRESYVCKILKENLNPVFSFWVLYTINRDWMAISLIQMREAGLVKAWDIWQRNIVYLALKGYHRKVEQQQQTSSFQVVELTHLWFIVLIWAAGLGASSLGFLIEFQQLKLI